MGEMTDSHKGFVVQRSLLSKLAACVGRLSKVPQARWSEKASPTATVPVAALRSLLHWAATGRLLCKRGGHKEAVCAALEAWGERSLANQVKSEGLQSQRQAPVSGITRPLLPTPIRAAGVRMRLGKRKAAGDDTSSSSKKHMPRDEDAVRLEQSNPKMGGSNAHKAYEKYKKAGTI